MSIGKAQDEKLINELREARAELNDLSNDLPQLRHKLKRAEDELSAARQDRDGDALKELTQRRDRLAGLLHDHQRLVTDAQAKVKRLEDAIVQRYLALTMIAAMMDLATPPQGDVSTPNDPEALHA